MSKYKDSEACGMPKCDETETMFEALTGYEGPTVNAKLCWAHRDAWVEFSYSNEVFVRLTVVERRLAVLSTIAVMMPGTAVGDVALEATALLEEKHNLLKQAYYVAKEWLCA